MKNVVIGIDFGGTTIKFGVVTENGKIIDGWSIPTPTQSAPKDTMKKITSEIIKRIEGNYHLLGIGLGIPGSVDPLTFKVYDCNNLGWNEKTDLMKYLKPVLKVPVIIENDANVAAIGERWQGAANKDNFMYITLGTGVGAGIVLNNHLIKGSTGAAGELGHVIVNPDGLKCTCGNRGCLETVSSATGIVRLYKQFAKIHTNITTKQIFDQAKKNSLSLENKTINIACDYLGLAIANVVNVLNLQEIIIGGGVSNAGEFLRSKIEKSMNQYLYMNNQKLTKVKLATLGNNAGIYGAAKLALNNKDITI